MQAQCLLNVSGDASIVVPLTPSPQAAAPSVPSSHSGTPTHCPVMEEPAQPPLKKVSEQVGAAAAAADAQTTPKCGQVKSGSGAAATEKGKKWSNLISSSSSADKKSGRT